MGRVRMWFLVWILMGVCATSLCFASDMNTVGEDDGNGGNPPARVVPLNPTLVDIWSAIRADTAQSIADTKAAWTAVRHRFGDAVWSPVLMGFRGVQSFLGELIQLTEHLILGLISLRYQAPFF